MSMSAKNDQPQTLMESGSIAFNQAHDSPVEVRRGMAVLTSEGETTGHVAAVVVDGRSGKVTHLVLGRSCRRLDYCLVPTVLIETVGDEEILLRIVHPVIENLPAWHGT